MIGKVKKVNESRCTVSSSYLSHQSSSQVFGDTRFSYLEVFGDTRFRPNVTICQENVSLIASFLAAPFTKSIRERVSDFMLLGNRNAFSTLQLIYQQEYTCIFLVSNQKHELVDRFTSSVTVLEEVGHPFHTVL